MQATVEAATTDGQVSGLQRRRRTGKKRLRFEPPVQMPPGVKELWRASSSEAQARAHQTCVAILAMWLGKKSREEVAQTLSIPPLRVWQLSQQALSGMLAGLLKQPRTRCKEQSTMPSEDSPRVLKKKVAELEAANKRLEELIQLVAQLPRPENAPPPRSTPSSRAAVKSRSRKLETAAEARGDELALQSSAAAR